MSKKNITFNFDMSNQNDILVYYYLTKLDTETNQHVYDKTIYLELK